ncbi:MAG: DUF819 family protein [Chitinophagales bacterium]
MQITILLQIILILLLPAGCIVLTKKLNISWLSPIVLCYVIGIVWGNIKGLPFHYPTSDTISSATLLLALPMILFATDLVSWFRYAKSTILSFALGMVGVVCSCLLGAWLFANQIPEIATISGMLVGVYSGGTPNMASIQIALDAPESLFILLTAADTICSGIYLIFLTTIAQSLLWRFLPRFSKKDTVKDLQSPKQQRSFATFDFQWKQRNTYLQLGKIIGLSLVVTALSVGIVYGITQELKDVAFIILLLTTFSIIASFNTKVRSLAGAYEVGQYCLLIFSVAVGSMADFDSLAQSGVVAFQFTAFVAIGAILLHYFFAWLFKIDADTVLITSTAAIFGPVFVGQIANVLDNQTLVLSGMTTGLVGYAIGNFLGLGIAQLVQVWLV